MVLVQRFAEVDHARFAQRMGLGQEHRRRAIVAATDLVGRQGARHSHVGLADDRQIVPERLEVLQMAVLCEIEVATDLRRREEVLLVAPSRCRRHSPSILQRR